MKRVILCLIIFLSVLFTAVYAQLVEPKRYICYKTDGSITIDGRLDEPSWKKAPCTDLFVDIEGDVQPRPRFCTRAMMVWDDTYFYVAVDIEEPDVWGTLAKRDTVIFYDNDFEVFIDPNGDVLEYYEFEMNALNTGWDLLLGTSKEEKGPTGNAWDIQGLRHAVQIYGTLNYPEDVDRGWSVEIAFPWEALAQYAHDRSTSPKDDDRWRVNFSRVEWQRERIGMVYRKIAGKREDNWVWSPQGVINMHIPGKWGYVQFSTAIAGTR